MDSRKQARWVFSIVGVRIRLDASWFIVVALVVWTLHGTWFPQALPGRSQATYLVMAIIGTLALFACLLAHELAHAIMARRFGVSIPRITLFIFGGIAELADEPPNAGAEFMMAVAGPIASATLGLGFWALGAALDGGSALQAVLAYLRDINLSVAVFNLVPGFPLDGGRILRAAIWGATGDLARATRIAALGGEIFAWFLMIIGALTLFSARDPMGLWLVLIGTFVWAAAHSTKMQLSLRQALKTVRIGQAMSNSVRFATPDQSLHSVATDIMLAHGISFLPVIADNQVVGVLDLDLMRTIPQADWPATTVRSAMARPGDANATTDQANAYDVLLAMLATGHRKRIVLAGGKVVGIVTLSDIIDYLGILQRLEAFLDNTGVGGPANGPATGPKSIPVR